MRVLVLWADPKSANLGVRVLAEGMASLARLAWGDDTLVDYQDFGPGPSEIGFGGRTIVRDLLTPSGPIATKLSRYDLILDSGAGDSFTDLYGLKRLLILHYAHRRSTRMGAQLILGPQTIGPFSSALSRTIGRASLARTTAVFARDSRSADFATRLGGQPLSSTDVVFALPPPARREQRDVIVNVSGLLWNGHVGVNAGSYRRALSRLVESLLLRGRSVSLLAHVLDNPSDDNDIPAVRELAARFGDIETLIPADLQTARELVANANLVIGSRMHACLNALSTGTPAIAWAYSRKFAPLMGDLGWPLSIDLQDGGDMTAKTLAILDDPGTDLVALAARLRSVAQRRLAITIDDLRSVANDRPRVAEETGGAAL